MRWQATVRTAFVGGPLSACVFPVAPFVPAARRVHVYLRTTVGVAFRQVADAPVPLLAGAAAVICAIHRTPMIERGSILGAATTLFGLLAIAVAALTAIARDFRTHRRWLRMVLSEIWLPLVLSANGLLIIVTIVETVSPSPVLPIIAWTLLVRALWVSLTLLDQTTAAVRLERAAYGFYERTAVNHDPRSLPFGRVGYRLRGALGIRWRLARADVEWSALGGPHVRARFDPEPGRLVQLYTIPSAGRVSRELADVLDRVNADLLRCTRRVEASPDLIGMSQDMGWFADAARDAAVEGRWTDLDAHVWAYIRFARRLQVFKRRFGSNEGIMVEAEVPGAALAIVFGRCETEIAVRRLGYIPALLDVLSEPPDDGTTWATLVATPIVTAAVTRASMAEAVELVEHLAMATRGAIWRWRCDDARMRTLFSDNGPVLRLLEAMLVLMRRMQMEYRDPELRARQGLLAYLIETSAFVGVENGRREEDALAIQRILDFRRCITAPFQWERLTRGGPTPQILTPPLSKGTAAELRRRVAP